MTLIQSIILGIIQGATEFIPVSSSGHMILIPWLLGWNQPGLLFNVVAHLGTATGVLFYFRRDWILLINLSFKWLVEHRKEKTLPKLLVLLIVGTLPVALLGLLLESQIEKLFTQPIVPAIFLLVTALLLAAGERASNTTKSEDELTVMDSLLIGLGQAFALLPGISRSGSTITVARFRRASRFTAARFSFLLATPIIIGAALMQIINALGNDNAEVRASLLIAGYFAAMISGLAVIHWLLNYLRSRSTLIFSAYCTAFSIVCIVLIVVRGA